MDIVEALVGFHDTSFLIEQLLKVFSSVIDLNLASILECSSRSIPGIIN